MLVRNNLMVRIIFRCLGSICLIVIRDLNCTHIIWELMIYPCVKLKDTRAFPVYSYHSRRREWSAVLEKLVLYVYLVYAWFFQPLMTSLLSMYRRTPSSPPTVNVHVPAERLTVLVDTKQILFDRLYATVPEPQFLSKFKLLSFGPEPSS